MENNKSYDSPVEIVRSTQNASSDLVFRFRNFVAIRSRRYKELSVLQAEVLSINGSIEL